MVWLEAARPYSHFNDQHQAKFRQGNKGLKSRDTFVFVK